MNEKWQKLTALKRSQWIVIFQSPFVVFVTWFRLRRGGYQEALMRIRVDPLLETAVPEQVNQARETAFALAAAIKYGPWRPRCLLRSLALGWFLGRQGVPFEIRIGVPADGGEVGFMAHAWVEVQGEVLNDDEGVADRYKAFDASCRSEFNSR